MPAAEFEPTIPASKRPHSHSLDRVNIEIGKVKGKRNRNTSYTVL